jgi:hypothetical protein
VFSELRVVNPTHILEPRDEAGTRSKTITWGKYGFLGSRVIEILKQNAINMKVSH